MACVHHCSTTQCIPCFEYPLCSAWPFPTPALRAASSSLLKHFLFSVLFRFVFVFERVSCSPGRIRIHYIPEDDPEHLIFLPLPRGLELSTTTPSSCMLRNVVMAHGFLASSLPVSCPPVPQDTLPQHTQHPLATMPASWVLFIGTLFCPRLCVTKYLLDSFS